MKKLLGLLMMFLITLHAMSQEFKKQEKVSSNLLCAIEYNSKMEPQSYYFIFWGQDSDYSYIYEPIALAYGSAQDVYDALFIIENFGKQVKENGVSIEYEDFTVTRINAFGKSIFVARDGKDAMFKDGVITKTKKKLIKYCQKNNIPLNL